MSTRRSLALLTMEDRKDYVVDEAVAIFELTRRGVQVEEVPWRRPTDWKRFDGVIVRTTWDYHRDLEGFLKVLSGIEAAAVPLANPLALVRWNARKTYLKDLAGRGVTIVPTRWGEGLAAAELQALPARLGAKGCVIKPVVSANAEDTFRFAADLDADAAARIAQRYQGREWMAQPFVTSIVSEGESSLFYFSGKFSHAVRKVPSAGDFRVQEEHGGHITGFSPDAALHAAAARVLAALEAPPLQARVDLVRLDDGSLALMELELIEPALYFRTNAEAPVHFADAVEAWLGRGAPA